MPAEVKGTKSSSLAPGQKTPCILHLDSLSGGCKLLDLLPTLCLCVLAVTVGATTVAAQQSICTHTGNAIATCAVFLPLFSPLTPTLAALANLPPAGSHNAQSVANTLRLYLQFEWLFKVGSWLCLLRSWTARSCRPVDTEHGSASPAILKSSRLVAGEPHACHAHAPWASGAYYFHRSSAARRASLGLRRACRAAGRPPTQARSASGCRTTSSTDLSRWAAVLLVLGLFAQGCLGCL